MHYVQKYKKAPTPNLSSLTDYASHYHFICLLNIQMLPLQRNDAQKPSLWQIKLLVNFVLSKDYITASLYNICSVLTGIPLLKLCNNSTVTYSTVTYSIVTLHYTLHFDKQLTDLNIIQSRA